jgi:hypothetical protein
MEDIRAIISRLPASELQIRRRCARDAIFRAICADYEEASKALRYWEQQAVGGGTGERGRVEEYGMLLAELEAEILTHLNPPVSRYNNG